MGVIFNRCERESSASAGRTVSLGAVEVGVCGSVFGLSLSTPLSCGLVCRCPIIYLSCGVYLLLFLFSGEWVKM